jgi:hypothetical protein
VAPALMSRNLTPEQRAKESLSSGGRPFLLPPREKRRYRSWDEWLSASPGLAIAGLVLFVAWMIATAFIPCQSTDPFYVCGLW